MSKTQPMADSRDMIVIHDMFRREFKAIPGLVSGVPGTDAAKVGIVADHVTPGNERPWPARRPTCCRGSPSTWTSRNARCSPSSTGT